MTVTGLKLQGSEWQTFFSSFFFLSVSLHDYACQRVIVQAVRRKRIKRLTVIYRKDIDRVIVNQINTGTVSKTMLGKPLIFIDFILLFDFFSYFIYLLIYFWCGGRGVSIMVAIISLYALS